MLLGALMVGPGLFAAGLGPSLGRLTRGVARLLGRLERGVLGRRLIGIGGIAIQTFAEGEILLLESNNFPTQFVHQLDQPLVLGKASRKTFLK